MVKKLPANAGDSGSISESQRASEEGNDNPLQCSCLENSMDIRELDGLQFMGWQRVGHD